jgi:hypothetical protein
MTIIFCLPLIRTIQDINTVQEPTSFIEHKGTFEELSESTEVIIERWNNSGTTQSMDRSLSKSIKNIMIYFKIKNNQCTWPEHSPYLCQWCCHSFTNMPCFIPVKRELNDTLKVRGNFCSFNCALSCIRKDYPNNYQRYSELLHYTAQLIDMSIQIIKPAPPKEVLEVFGGEITIDEYRQSFTTLTDYTIIYPPVISEIPIIETTTQKSNTNQSTTINSNKLIIEKSIPDKNNKIILTRNKKLVQKKIFG